MTRIPVIYSPGYGAGWSTWNSDPVRKEMLHDRELARLIEQGDSPAIQRYVADTYGSRDEHVCVLASPNLAVEWLERGARFRVDEYDGSEGVVLGDDWETA